MIIRAHGEIDSSINRILLNEEETEVLYSYGHPSNISDNYLDDSVEYENLKLVLFMNCHSGEESYNFADRIWDLGARNAIGFVGTQNKDAADNWEKVFWEAYCAGNSIETCVRVACDNTIIPYSSVVISGNPENTVYYYLEDNVWRTANS